MKKAPWVSALIPHQAFKHQILNPNSNNNRDFKKNKNRLKTFIHSQIYSQTFFTQRPTVGDQ